MRPCLDVPSFVPNRAPDGRVRLRLLESPAAPPAALDAVEAVGAPC